MKFKEFAAWCNERACDGCWSINTAMNCVAVYDALRRVRFWKREKVWREEYEQDVLRLYVNPTNELIAKYFDDGHKAGIYDAIEQEDILNGRDDV